MFQTVVYGVAGYLWVAMPILSQELVT